MDPYYYPLFSDDIPIFLMCAFLVVITSVQCPYIGEWVPGSPPSGLPGDGGIYWPRKGQNAATIGSHQSQQALVWDDENWMGQLGKLGLISWMWASSPLGHRIPRMEALSSSCKIRIFQSWHCLNIGYPFWFPPILMVYQRLSWVFLKWSFADRPRFQNFQTGAEDPSSPPTHR